MDNIMYSRICRNSVRFLENIKEPVQKELKAIAKTFPEASIHIASDGKSITFDINIKGRKRKNKANPEDLVSFLVSRLPGRLLNDSLLRYYKDTKIYISKEAMSEIKSNLGIGEKSA